MRSISKAEQQRAKELTELEQRIEQLTPEVKDLERLSEALSRDSENILPEAAPPESAKNCREKKVKPLFEKMAKMILKLRSTIISLGQEIRTLEQKYAEERTKVTMLERLLTDKQKKMLKERNVFHREKSF